MSSLVDIQLQIDKLTKQAQAIKTKEFAKTVQDIRQKMKAFGITAKDLQVAKSSKSGEAGGQTKPGKKSTSQKGQGRFDTKIEIENQACCQSGQKASSCGQG